MGGLEKLTGLLEVNACNKITRNKIKRQKIIQVSNGDQPLVTIYPDEKYAHFMNHFTK